MNTTRYAFSFVGSPIEAAAMILAVVMLVFVGRLVGMTHGDGE